MRLPLPAPGLTPDLCEKARAEGLVPEMLLTAPSVAAPSGTSAASGERPGPAGRSGPRAGPPAKLAKTQHAGGLGRHGQDDAPASSACCGSTPSMIPNDALRVGGQLGAGLCGIVNHGW